MLFVLAHLFLEVHAHFAVYLKLSPGSSLPVSNLGRVVHKSGRDSRVNPSIIDDCIEAV